MNTPSLELNFGDQDLSFKNSRVLRFSHGRSNDGWERQIKEISRLESSVCAACAARRTFLRKRGPSACRLHRSYLAILLLPKLDDSRHVALQGYGAPIVFFDLRNRSRGARLRCEIVNRDLRACSSDPLCAG
jgi:hypothetical protein